MTHQINFYFKQPKNQKNFALYETNLDKISEIDWKLLVPHRNNELIEDFLCFKTLLFWKQDEMEFLL